MKKVLTIIFFTVFCVAAQETSKDSLVVNIEQKNLFLTVVSWPFVYIVQPTVEFLMYPAIPPLIYVSRENLIDKGHNLITFGENKQIMLYPIVNAKLGNQANIGLAYWHSNLLLDRDNIFFSPHLYINADWDFILRYKKNGIFGTSFYSGTSMSYKEDGDNSFIDTKTGREYSFADTSFYVSGFLGFNLVGNWGLEFGLSVNFHRFDFPSIYAVPFNGEDVDNRGFYKNYMSYPLALSLSYNNIDAPYVPTKGRKFSFSYAYTPVSSYSGSRDHNYHVLDSRLVNYSLLGNRSYAMTVAESDINRERLKNLSFAEAIEMLNPINVKEETLDRRVLIAQLKARYMIEENEGKAPFTAMSKLGGNFPLRAYGDGYFTAPLVIGVSTEYRWPIDRFADMLIFNEYGIYADDFGGLSASSIKNSYGFGFRVRTPKLFITRFALAFHGRHGITLILTTRPEYD